jgi:hypothetical protein
MYQLKWLLALTALVAVGLFAGCGSSSSSTSTPSTSAAGSSSTTTSASAGATPTDVYNACVDALNGTAAESQAQSACGPVRTAFEQCNTQAENAPAGSARDTAIKACQEAADKSTAALKSAP